MTVYHYRNDLPADLDLGSLVAIDTETMGLIHRRDRLCAVQLSAGDGNAHIVQLMKGEYDAPNLKKLLTDPNVTKIFHFARFDIAAILMWLNVVTAPVYCTKIASKLVRTFTDRHGLRELVKEFTGSDLSKQQQTSDWGAKDFTEAQKIYAANDVLFLHAIKAGLDEMLEREGRTAMAQACFDFLPIRGELDLAGWCDDKDIFNHS